MTVSFPNPLEVLITREFKAPIQLVFDVLCKEEHLRKTIAPFEETVTECRVDLRVGGDYRFVFVTPEGVECAFFGTFLEVAEPHRTRQTWHFGGWPDAEAIETMDLVELDGVTRMTWLMAFTDQAGRDNMTKYDGIASGYDKVEAYLQGLVTND